MRFQASALAACVLLACVLAACGDRDRDTDRRDGSRAGESGLPSPGSSSGVTGAADVAAGREGDAPLLGSGPEPVADPAPADPFFTGLPPEQATNPETGLGVDPDGDGPLTAPPAVDTGAAEPTPADAVAVIREYYAAIARRDHAAAYRLWREDGAASGQTPGQFAAGFAQTQGASVEIGAPGAVDAGAGSRYIEVPVSATLTDADGNVRVFSGSYVLHRAVADGASPSQRAWRIQGADLRERQP